MVRLHTATGDQQICLLYKGLRNGEFKLAQFITGSGRIGEVISLDPDTWSADVR